MLQVPQNGSALLKDTIEAINFFIALPQGTVTERRITSGPSTVFVYRSSYEGHEGIIVQCYQIGGDTSYMALLISAIENAGYQPLKPYAGVHFYLSSKRD
ncbi:MAG TPA: hypothetical protein VJM46_00470 [Candidatus Saccharimonadales bacterium]|nr:hypothetical protein [Candidatus Saccharimonadales bacterium]